MSPRPAFRCQECSSPDPRAGLFPRRWADMLKGYSPNDTRFPCPRASPMRSLGTRSGVAWAQMSTARQGAGLSARQSGFRVSKRHVSVHKLQLPQLPNSAVPLLTTRQRLTTTIPYSLNTWARTPCFRQDLAECRQGLFIVENSPQQTPQVLPLSNGIVGDSLRRRGL